jgi:phage shock protein PspC (stress-responsive transcriptional regulator)
MNSQLRAVLLIVFGFSVAVAVSLYLVAAYIAAVYQEYQRRKSN